MSVPRQKKFNREKMPATSLVTGIRIGIAIGGPDGDRIREYNTPLQGTCGRAEPPLALPSHFPVMTSVNQGSIHPSSICHKKRRHVDCLLSKSMIFSNLLAGKVCVRWRRNMVSRMRRSGVY